MSYLLDALKQSQPSDMSAEHYDLQAQQAKQQATLARYRLLAYVLGGGLVVCFTLGGGFIAGKWLQSTTLNSAAEQVTGQAMATKSNDQQQVSASNETSDPLASGDSITQNSPISAAWQGGAQTANTAAALKGQVVYVQTPSGIQQMLLTPQGQYVPLFNNQATNPAIYNAQVQVNQPYTGQLNNQVNINQPDGNELDRNQSTQATAGAEQAQANSPSSAMLDLSKYKVLGKPLAEPQNRPSAVKEIPRTSEPTPIEAAFQQAVQETEKKPNYQVTQATRNSSRVQPVELLPDGLQALLPALKYQAHIYSSSEDKRWIKLNGRELYEGDSIGALTVREIAPEQSVLDFDGYQFSLKALQDWPQ